MSAAPGGPVLSAHELVFSWPARHVFNRWSADFGAGLTWLTGANGSGKSTLLRVLTEREAPDAGRVVWERGIAFADFNQIAQSLDPADTVTHAVNITGIAYGAPRRHVNRFLELLRFSEYELKQRIGTLSGGQRARVALACCLLSGAAAVILDEPTNHLDVPSIQVLERALAHFPGAVLVVSHDRFFIDTVANRLLAFTPMGQIAEATGNWTRWHERGALFDEDVS